jgi:predicted enzyme related to lactoylglutathione lyase
MTSGMKTVIYPVGDIAAAKKFYGALVGAAPSMDEAYYVQFEVGDQRIGLDPGPMHKGLQGPVGYWDVDDAEKAVQTLVDGGGQIALPLQDVGGGKRRAVVKDVDGNLIGVIDA